MYIKSITLRGFRTYKDEATVVLSPNYNAIVGLNGSGKSNILLGVAFILSSDLGAFAKERKIYLHEGASTSVTTAFVEITFDNSDRRLSMFDKDEVVIKRVFSAKKDDWLINGKHVNKSEFVHLMESAGFSRSNPYYIVRQGKISELTTMSDESRMKLLRDVAGTKTYDERRHESLKLLLNTDKKRKTVEETLNSIGKKIDALKAEQGELQRYRECIRDKKYIEYLLNELAWKEALDKEIEAEKRYNTCREKLTDLDSENQNKINENENLQNNQKRLEEEVRQLKKQKEGLNEEFVEVEGELARSRVDLESILCEENEKKKKKEKLQNEKEKLEEEIHMLEEGTSEELRVKCEAAEKEFEKIQQKKNLIEQQLNIIYEKFGRLSDRRSAKQQSEILKKKIDEKKKRNFCTKNQLTKYSAANRRSR